MKAKMTKKPVTFDKAIPHMISVIDSQDREDIPYYLAMLIADHFDKRVRPVGRVLPALRLHHRHARV